MRLSGILYSPQNYHPQGPWILHCISTLIHELRTRPPAAWWSSPNSWASPPGDPTLWRSDDHLRWSGKLTSFDQEITGLDLEILIQDIYIYIYIYYFTLSYIYSIWMGYLDHFGSRSIVLLPGDRGHSGCRCRSDGGSAKLDQYTE